MSLYFWIALAVIAFLVVIWCVVMVIWVLILCRMSQSGSTNWDELEDDVELRPHV